MLSIGLLVIDILFVKCLTLIIDHVKAPDEQVRQFIWYQVLVVVVLILIRRVVRLRELVFSARATESAKRLARDVLINRAIVLREIKLDKLNKSLNEGVERLGQSLNDFLLLINSVAYSLALVLFIATQSIVFGVLAIVIVALSTFYVLLSRSPDRMIGDNLHESWMVLHNRLVRLIRHLPTLAILRTTRMEAQTLYRISRELEESLIRFYNRSAKTVVRAETLGLLAILLGASLAVVFRRRFEALDATQIVVVTLLFIRLLQVLATCVKAHSNLVYLRSSVLELFGAIGYESRSSLALADGAHEEKSEGWVIRPPVGVEVIRASVDFIEFRGGSSFDLLVEPGDFVCLSGRSGAGKSTLIGIVAGVVQLKSGQIRFFEKTGVFTDRNKFRLGYVGPEPLAIDGTILENLVYGLSNGVERDYALKVLGECGCDFIKRNEDLDRTLSEFGEGLSTGQLQRLCLARALIGSPSIVLLDEPTANLDEDNELKLIEAIRGLKGRVTIICATHSRLILSASDRTIHLSPSE